MLTFSVIMTLYRCFNSDSKWKKCSLPEPFISNTLGMNCWVCKRKNYQQFRHATATIFKDVGRRATKKKIYDRPSQIVTANNVVVQKTSTVICTTFWAAKCPLRRPQILSLQGNVTDRKAWDDDSLPQSVAGEWCHTWVESTITRSLLIPI